VLVRRTARAWWCWAACAREAALDGARRAVDILCAAQFRHAHEHCRCGAALRLWLAASEEAARRRAGGA
jgi:hypothetical protein